MYKKLTPILVILTACLILSACNLPGSQAAPNNSPDQINTAVAQTVEALNTQMAPTATQPAPPTAAPTNTTAPTVGPTTTTAPPTSTPVTVPCNAAAFVSESPADGQTYSPNTAFTKQWTLKNIGSCTWSTNYSLVFDSGDPMGAPASKHIPLAVPTNGTVTITVDLKAPGTTGTYKGNFKLASDTGERFGIGAANGPFWVQIVSSSGGGSGSFAVTDASVSVDTATVTEIADVSGNCASHKFTFTGSITVSAPGTVTYYWKRSDASSPTTQSITFTSAGTQTVSTDWTYGATTATSPRNASMAIYIDTPNHQLFPATSVSLICH